MYEDDFMEVKIYISLNSEIRINTQLKDTSTNYTKSDTITKRLVLLPVDWYKNGLRFTKRLHMKKKIIGYSQARTIMKHIQL